MSTHESLSRREFATRAMLAAAATSVVPVTAIATATVIATTPAEADAQVALQVPARGVADMQLEMLKHLYPDHLTDELLATLRTKLDRQHLRSRLLSSFPLTNADEPAISFAAYRADG